MIEKRYGKYIRDDGDAPLRALFESKTETFTETFWGGTREVRENIGGPNGRLTRYPHHAGDLTELSPEFRPAISPIIAPVQIPVPAAGKDHLRVERLHVHHPHGRIGWDRQGEIIPGHAGIV